MVLAADRPGITWSKLQKKIYCEIIKKILYHHQQQQLQEVEYAYVISGSRSWLRDAGYTRGR